MFWSSSNPCAFLSRSAYQYKRIFRHTSRSSSRHTQKLFTAMLARDIRLWSDDGIVSNQDIMRSERDMCSRSPQVHPAKCQQNGEWHFDPRLGDMTRTARASHLEKRCNGARFASISSSAYISARYGSPRYASPSRAADLSRAFVAVSRAPHSLLYTPWESRAFLCTRVHTGRIDRRCTHFFAWCSRHCHSLNV